MISNKIKELYKITDKLPRYDFCPVDEEILIKTKAEAIVVINSGGQIC